MRPKQDPKPSNRGYYVTGDGDVLQSRRAGSDHSHLKSKGF